MNIITPPISENVLLSTRALTRLSDRIKLSEITLPELKPGMLLIEVKSSLISPGSELGGWPAFLRSQLKPPHDVNFGYSNSGIVKAIGDGVSQFKVGDRVASIGAGYAQHSEQAIVPSALTVPLPEKVSHDEGAFAMLMATALHGLRSANITMGDRVMVAGLGMLGNLTAQFFKAAGCRVAGWDIDSNAIEIAAQTGIDTCFESNSDQCIDDTRAWTKDEGLDIACWAMSGDANELWRRTVATMRQSPDGHATGRLVIIGHPNFTFQSRPMTNLEIVQSSRTGPGYHDPAYEAGAAYPPVFVRWDTRRNLEYCFELVAQKRIELEPLISHRFAMKNVEEEFSKLNKSTKNPFGVIIQMNRASEC